MLYRVNSFLFLTETHLACVSGKKKKKQKHFHLEWSKKETTKANGPELLLLVALSSRPSLIPSAPFTQTKRLTPKTKIFQRAKELGN